MAFGIEAVLAEAERRPITVDISTIGRQSGSVRRIEIWIVAVAGRAYIGGTPRPRDWLANLRAHGRLTVHFTGDPEGFTYELAATAAEVIDVARRRTVWEHPSTAWYRTQVSVADLVERAPLVALTFDD